MDKQPVGTLPDLTASSLDDEIMVITNSEYNQLKKEKISDLITDFTSTNENNALTKGTDGKMFVTDFGNAANITDGTLPTSVLPEIPLEKLPVSGVTADTYAYPSSVTVNAQGQVTAIEEGTPSGSNANTDLSNITEAGKAVINHFSTSIGEPIITLSNTLGENEIWLEGAEISRTTYAALFEIYGTTYGEGNGETTFNLPDFRNRTLWGASDFGYIEAGLPNITGSFRAVALAEGEEIFTGPFSVGSFGSFGFSTTSSNMKDCGARFNAQNSNPIYGNSSTVQPPSVKVRVKTRYA